MHSIHYNSSPSAVSARKSVMSHQRTYPCLRLTLIGIGAAALLALFGGHADSQRRDSSSPVNHGTTVQWEGWRFNWSLRSVEGLVLTDVYFRGRKVLNYAGIAELLTAYDQGEPRPLDL